MNPPLLSKSNIADKSVLVRADLDVDFDLGDTELLRLEALLPTLKLLAERNCKITILGHKGRPQGKHDPALSLKPIEDKLHSMLPNVNFRVLENVRFDPREEANDPRLAAMWAGTADIYVNEAFAVSHRENCSVSALPQQMRKLGKDVYLGLRFEQEIANLSKVLVNPKKPVVFIVSGVKKDKVVYAQILLSKADKILLGGRLPEYIGEDPEFAYEPKFVIAKLIPDKEDITIHSIEAFEKEVASAGTIILAGVLGKYEETGHRMGTERVFKAVSEASAFKITGGGDSIVAAYMFNLQSKFDWISVGGGAMLEYLAKGTLPGIKSVASG